MTTVATTSTLRGVVGEVAGPRSVASVAGVTPIESTQGSELAMPAEFFNAHARVRAYVERGWTLPAAVYHLEQTLTLGAGESLLMDDDAELRIGHTGTGVSVAASNVTIAGGAIHGSDTVEFTDAGDGTWTCPWDDATAWVVGDLFKNGVRVPCSQWPLEDWASTTATINDTQAYAAGVVPAYDASEWMVRRYFVVNWVAKFWRPSSSEHNALHLQANPIRVLNNRNALTAGRFCHDYAANLLVYKPLEGEVLAACEFRVPYCDRLLEIKGTSGTRLTGVVVDSVSFSGSRWVWTDWSGATYDTTGSWAYAIGDGGAGFDKFQLYHSYATGTEIKNCLFTDAGCSGVYLAVGSVECEFHNNRIEDCFTLPLRVVGNDNVVESNKFLTSGLLVPNCAGVHFAGTDNELRGNEIAYHGYSGVIDLSTRGVVANNHIHHVMQLAGDGAGIYTIGPTARSLTWSGNYIHDITPDNSALWNSFGIYFDANIRDTLTQDNLLVRCQPYSIYNQYYTEGNFGLRDKWYHDPDGRLPSVAWPTYGWQSFDATYPRTTWTRAVAALGEVTGEVGSRSRKLYFNVDCLNRYAKTDAPFEVLEKTTHGGYDALLVKTSRTYWTSWPSRSSMLSSWCCMNVLVTDDPEDERNGTMSEFATACRSYVSIEASVNMYMRFAEAGTTTDPLFVAAEVGDFIYYPMVTGSSTSGNAPYYTDKWFVAVQKDVGDMTKDLWFKSKDFGPSDPWDGTFWIEIEEDDRLSGYGQLAAIEEADVVRLMVHHIKNAEALDEAGMEAAVAAWVKANPEPVTP